MHNPFQQSGNFGSARAAIGARPENCAHGIHAERCAAFDCFDDRVDADTKT
jgi:hypothetical protein